MAPTSHTCLKRQDRQGCSAVLSNQWLNGRRETAMTYQLNCDCGRILPVSERQAGSSIVCSCGRTINVPASTEQCNEAVIEGMPPLAPAPLPRTSLSAELDRFASIIAPTELWLQTEGGMATGESMHVLAALTPDTFW